MVRPRVVVLALPVADHDAGVDEGVKGLFVDLVGSDTRGVMGGVYGSRSPRIRSANH